MAERLVLGAASAMALWSTAKAFPAEIIESAGDLETGSLVATDATIEFHDASSNCTSTEAIFDFDELRYGMCELSDNGNYFIIGGCDESGLMMGVECDYLCATCEDTVRVVSSECSAVFNQTVLASFTCSNNSTTTSTTASNTTTFSFTTAGSVSTTSSTSGMPQPCPRAPVVNNVLTPSSCVDIANSDNCSLSCEAGYAPKDDEPVIATCQNGFWFVTGFCLRPGSSGTVRSALQSNWNLNFNTTITTLDISDLSDALVEAVMEFPDLGADAMVRVDITLPEDGDITASESTNGRRLDEMYNPSLRTEISTTLPDGLENNQDSGALRDFEDLFTGEYLRSALIRSMPPDLRERLLPYLEIESAGPFIIVDGYMWIEPEWVQGNWSACTCDGEQVRTAEMICSVDQWTLCTEEKETITEACPCDWDIMCPWGDNRAEAEDAGVSCGAQFGISLALAIIFVPCLLLLLILLCWAIVRTPCINSGGLTVRTDSGQVKTKYNITSGNSQDHEGKKVVKWGLSNEDAKTLFPDAGTLSSPKKEDLDTLFGNGKVADIEDPNTKDAEALEDASPRAIEWLKSKSLAYEDKASLEYFSSTLGMWRPGYVMCALGDPSNVDRHVRVQYNMHLPLSGQTRRDAGLFDMRPAFAMGEKVEVFFPDAGSSAGTWKAGEIAEQPTVSSTTYGYVVQIDDNANAKPQKVMAVRLRRRFDVDEKVLVYLGLDIGWSAGTIKSLHPAAAMDRGDKDFVAGPSEGPDPLSVEKWSAGKDVPKGMVPWKLVSVLVESKSSDERNERAFPTYLVQRQNKGGGKNFDGSLVASVIERGAAGVTGLFGGASSPASAKSNA